MNCRSSFATHQRKGNLSAGPLRGFKKLENGLYLLDFNLAYNPACAFSEYYNCPVPPKENMLKMAIQAGERAPIMLRPLDPELLPGRAAIPTVK